MPDVLRKRGAGEEYGDASSDEGIENRFPCDAVAGWGWTEDRSTKQQHRVRHIHNLIH